MRYGKVVKLPMEALVALAKGADKRAAALAAAVLRNKGYAIA